MRAIALALVLTACASAPPPPHIDVSAPDAARVAQQNGGRHVCVTGDVVGGGQGEHYFQLPHDTPPGLVAPNARRIYVSARTAMMRRQIVDRGAAPQTICGTLIVDQYHGDSDLFHLVVHRRG